MIRIALTALALAAVAGAARADPCARIPDRGAMPAELTRGRTFAGPVVYVGDGDSLCVDIGGGGGQGWVEVRLADFNAPEINEPAGRAARAVLIGLVMGRGVRCVAGHRSWDRVVAVCRRDGDSVGDLMRRDGVVEGGR